MVQGDVNNCFGDWQAQHKVPIWVRQQNSVAFSDVPTRSGGRMPDFCIIGAAKAGTTALNEILGQHPQIFMNPLKEPHYLSTEAIWSYGEEWYRGLYADAHPDQLCGEASASYTFYPLVPGTAERMASANPDMKLIYLLREPVARIQSSCLQVLRYSQNVLNIDSPEKTLDAFLEAIAEPEDPRHTPTISASRYIDQIEIYEAVFSRRQMLILFQDELKESPKDVLRTICDFLGIAPMNEGREDARSNVTADFIEGLERVRQTDKLRRLPFYDAAKRLLPGTVKKRILAILPTGMDESETRLSAEVQARLTEEFRAPNSKLRDWLGELPEDWSY